MMVNQRKAGVLLTYISEIIKILSALIYTPIMLRLLGQSEFGLYQLVYSTVAYLSILSLGFSASYVRYYSKFKAKNETEEISRLNGMYMVIFLVVAGIATVCGLAMILNIRACFGTGLTEEEYNTAKILMAFMVLNLAITFPNSVFTSITAAHEEFFFQRLLIVLKNLLNPFLTLPLLLLGYGSVGMVFVTTCVTIGHLVSNIWFVCFRLHEKFVFNNFNFLLLKDIWVFTFFIFLNQITDQVNWNIGKFLLGRMLGTTAVAIYGLGAQINTMYLMFSTSISSVFVPKVNQIVAESDDNHELSLLFTRIGRLQFILLSLIMTGFIFLGKQFISFWGGINYIDSYYVAVLLIVPVTVPLIQNLGIEIQRAKFKHQARAVVYFFVAIGNIFLSIPLIKAFGLIGAAMGTALSLVAGNILFMNWYYNYKIGLEIKEFWKNISSFFPALLPPIIIGICLMYFVPMEKVVTFGICALVYTIVFCFSMWFLGMNTYEKGLIINSLQRFKGLAKKSNGR